MIPKRNTNNVKSSNFYLSDLYLLLYKILDIYIHTLFYTPSQITQLIQNGQVLIVAMRSMSKLINKKIMIYNHIFSFFFHIFITGAVQVNSLLPCLAVQNKRNTADQSTQGNREFPCTW